MNHVLLFEEISVVLIAKETHEDILTKINKTVYLTLCIQKITIFKSDASLLYIIIIIIIIIIALTSW